MQKRAVVITVSAAIVIFIVAVSYYSLEIPPWADCETYKTQQVISPNGKRAILIEYQSCRSEVINYRSLVGRLYGLDSSRFDYFLAGDISQGAQIPQVIESITIKWKDNDNVEIFLPSEVEVKVALERVKNVSFFYSKKRVKEKGSVTDRSPQNQT